MISVPCLLINTLNFKNFSITFKVVLVEDATVHYYFIFSFYDFPLSAPLGKCRICRDVTEQTVQ